MKINILCPQCLNRLKNNGDSIDCPFCGSHYEPGEEINIPLGKLFKLKSKENSIISRNKKRREEAKKKQGDSPKKGAEGPNPKRLNQTGFFGVTRIKPKRRNPRGRWRYRAKNLDIEIVRVSLTDLESAVKKAGGKWIVVDDELAEKSRKINERLEVI